MTGVKAGEKVQKDAMVGKKVAKLVKRHKGVQRLANKVQRLLQRVKGLARRVQRLVRGV